MAERKAALRRAPSRPALDALLAEARNVTLSEDEIREQLASFVYGKAPRGSRITKDSARRAATRVRVLV
jgi:hypothetical protein